MSVELKLFTYALVVSYINASVKSPLLQIRAEDTFRIELYLGKLEFK
jgi:hypothetical protein